MTIRTNVLEGREREPSVVEVLSKYTHEEFLNEIHLVLNTQQSLLLEYGMHSRIYKTLGGKLSLFTSGFERCSSLEIGASIV